MNSQAKGHGFDPQAPFSFSDVMCEIIFLYCDLFGEGKHRQETRTNLLSNSIDCMKFSIRTWPALELKPKPFGSEGPAGMMSMMIFYM